MDLYTIGLDVTISAGATVNHDILLQPAFRECRFDRFVVPDSTPACIFVDAITRGDGTPLLDSQATMVPLSEIAACVIFGIDAPAHHMMRRDPTTGMGLQVGQIVRVQIRNIGDAAHRVRGLLMLCVPGVLAPLRPPCVIGQPAMLRCDVCGAAPGSSHVQITTHFRDDDSDNANACGDMSLDYETSWSNSECAPVDCRACLRTMITIELVGLRGSILRPWSRQDALFAKIDGVLHLVAYSPRCEPLLRGGRRLVPASSLLAVVEDEARVSCRGGA
jgi:hypothetical protein